MKKILIIHPALVVGGAEVILINYLKVLSSLSDKYQVELLLIEDRVNFNRDKIPANIKVDFILSDVESEFFIYCFLNLDKPNHNYYSSWFQGIKNRINKKILDKINEGGYNVIIDFHRNVSSFSDFLKYHSISETIPVIYWLHSQHPIDGWKSDTKTSKNLLPKYRKFVSISQEMNDYCKKCFEEIGIDSNKLVNIYNPVDQEAIIQQAENALPEDETLLSQDFILQVSRLDPIKNHEEMIDIFYELKQKGIKEKLYIIGDGDKTRDELQEKIRSLHLENECFLLDKRDNPYPFMKKAKLFIHTSKLEGLPTVLIESMVCGTPVVAYNCPSGPKDILENGKYGKLIPLHHKADFIQAAYELLTNESTRQHYISLLPEAITRFSLTTKGKELEALLDNL